MAFHRKRSMQALAVIGIAVLGLTACGSTKKASTTTPTSSGSGSSSGTLKLGFFGALTGANAALGINIENGEKLAISQYMATHPSVGVAIDAFDSQGNPAQANNGATKLIGDKVVAVIGPAFSGESAAADPIFESAQVPNVSASATAVALATHGWKFFHRVLANDGVQGPADADYIAKVLHSTKVAVIDDNSTYGAGLSSTVKTQLGTAGATIVTTDHVDPNGADYGSTVNKIVASGATAVFYGGYYDAAGRLVHQLRSAGYKGFFVSGDGSEDQRFVTDAGGSPAEGSFLSCPCADETHNPAAASFVSAYQAAFGTPPAIYSAEAYDATNFVLAAIKGGNTTGPAINTYLANNTYQGLTKTIKFQADGNVAASLIYIYKVESGKIVQIGTST